MFVFKDWTVDPLSRHVTNGSKTVRLSPKAMEVLSTLHRAGGGVVSRADVLSRVWPNVTVGEEVLTQAIAELRRAFGDDRCRPKYVETIQKRGYRLLLDNTVPHTSICLSALEKYAACLRAGELFFRGGQANVRHAAELFAEVLATDPNDVLALAGMARCLFFANRYFGEVGDCETHISTYAKRAVALGPDCPEAHAGMGLAHAADGRYRDALASFSTAVSLGRESAEVHYLLGRLCLGNGDYGLAAAMLERAAALRDGDFHALMLAAKARRFIGDDRAWRCNLIQAQQRIVQRLEADPYDGRAIVDQAFCNVELGEVNEGVESATALIRNADDGNFFYLTCALARAGEVALAIDAFEKVVESGWSDMVWLANDHDVDSVRREPRFQRIVSQVRAA